MLGSLDATTASATNEPIPADEGSATNEPIPAATAGIATNEPMPPESGESIASDRRVTDEVPQVLESGQQGTGTVLASNEATEFYAALLRVMKASKALLILLACLALAGLAGKLAGEETIEPNRRVHGSEPIPAFVRPPPHAANPIVGPPPIATASASRRSPAETSRSHRCYVHLDWRNPSRPSIRRTSAGARLTSLGRAPSYNSFEPPDRPRAPVVEGWNNPFIPVIRPGGFQGSWCERWF